MDINYQDLDAYYQSPEWASKRNARLKLDGFSCAICGFTRALEVHHINYNRLYHEDVSKDLITLCKKCHSEIEAQKKALDPIPLWTEHHSVYLAGKIRKYDWRSGFHRINVYEPDTNSASKLAEFYVDVNEELTVTGPFFISCDHGCYHGSSSHGVGAVDSLHSDEWGGCMGNFFTRDDVFNICKRQIDRAEIVFAYIDQNDCYGTLAEIGYAHAKGKEIIIVFDNPDLKREMWFADKMQRNTGIASHGWVTKNLTSRFEHRENPSVEEAFEGVGE